MVKQWKCLQNNRRWNKGTRNVHKGLGLRENLLKRRDVTTYFRINIYDWKEKKANIPFFLCSSKEYNALKDNTILLGNPRVINGNSINRKIYYDIISVGRNIHYKNRKEQMIIRLKNTKKNTMFIMIHRKYLNELNNIHIHEYCNGTRRKSLNSCGKYGLLLVCTTSEHKKQDKGYIFDQ